MTEAEVDKWMKFYRRFQWPDPSTELNQIRLKHGMALFVIRWTADGKMPPRSHIDSKLVQRTVEMELHMGTTASVRAVATRSSAWLFANAYVTAVEMRMIVNPV
jgi:hypothetical protein